MSKEKGYRLAITPEATLRITNAAMSSLPNAKTKRVRLELSCQVEGAAESKTTSLVFAVPGHGKQRLRRLSVSKHTHKHNKKFEHARLSIDLVPNMHYILEAVGEQ